MYCESRPADEVRQRTIQIVATFTAMMHADERGELSIVEEAQRALVRLGIVVWFTHSIPPTQAMGGAA